MPNPVLDQAPFCFAGEVSPFIYSSVALCVGAIAILSESEVTKMTTW